MRLLCNGDKREVLIRLPFVVLPLAKRTGLKLGLSAVPKGPEPRSLVVEAGGLRRVLRCHNVHVLVDEDRKRLVGIDCHVFATDKIVSE